MHGYYLQHMGIERWVLRPPRSQIKKANHDSLMVISNNQHGFFEGSAGVLFSRMLQSIALLPEQVYLTMDGEQLNDEIARVKPRVILRYASLPAAEVYVQETPQVVSYHTEHLLQCPAD